MRFSVYFYGSGDVWYGELVEGSNDVGFKPSVVITWGADRLNYYNSSKSTTQAYYGSTGTAIDTYALGGNSQYHIKSIDSNGFTMNSFINTTGWIGFAAK